MRSTTLPSEASYSKLTPSDSVVGAHDIASIIIVVKQIADADLFHLFSARLSDIFRKQTRQKQDTVHSLKYHLEVGSVSCS
jgi:hypothetical protein